MEYKVCKKCNCEVEINKFNKDNRTKIYPDGRRNICNNCINTPDRLDKLKEYNKEYGKTYRLSKKEITKEYNKEYRCSNREILREKKKIYYRENRNERLKYYHYNKKRINDLNYKWRIENKEYIKEYKNEYTKSRKKVDKLYKLKVSIRSLICISLKNKFTEKSSKTIDILGCSYEEFKSYIEGMFDEYMNWDNYGSYWHLDHIVPISWGKTKNEIMNLNRYTNFQPLY